MDSHKGERIGVGEKLKSYDVMALFISVPVDHALVMISEYLEKDSALKERIYHSKHWM